MATPEHTDRPTWQVLLALAGAATAIVIVVYLIGGAIVWERLHVLGLPANQAVAPLPRDLLLVDGVRALAWPVALGLAAAGLVRLFSHIFQLGQRGSRAAWAVLVVLWIGGLVILLPSVLHRKVLGVKPLPHFSTWQKFGFLAALGLLVAVALIASRRQLVPLRRAALGTALAMAAVAVVIEAIDVYLLPVRMEYAHVRLRDQPKIVRGFYIGATSDAVYLALNHDCHVRRKIVALPRSRVVNLVVFTSTKAWPRGADTGGDCQLPP